MASGIAWNWINRAPPQTPAPKPSSRPEVTIPSQLEHRESANSLPMNTRTLRFTARGTALTLMLAGLAGNLLAQTAPSPISPQDPAVPRISSAPPDATPTVGA